MVTDVVRGRTAEAELFTEVVLAVFRVNGMLLSVGDSLASTAALTAAGWQVLGALALAGQPLRVPQVARRMGLTRQSVHETVNRLVAEGLVVRIPSPDHARSHSLQMTEEGSARYAAVTARQIHWSNEVARGLSRAALGTTVRTLNELSTKLEHAPLDS